MPSSADPAAPPLERPSAGDWRGPVVDRARAAERFVLATDFDGTLADIRDDPDAVEIRPGARDALDALAGAPGTDVAVVSGRALADVRERVGLDGVAYAGNHGLEMDAGDEPFVHPDAAAATDAIDDACAALRERLAGVDGAFVEEKGVTATVHYRQVDDPATVERVREAVRAAAERSADLRVSEGKRVRELRPDVDWDKGRAVSWVLDALDVDAARSHAVYLGDDVTDEDAFRSPDVETGVVVGDPDETAADYRVDSPAAVADFLSRLAAVRPGD